MKEKELFELLRTIADNLPEALFRTDAEGKVVWVNPAAAELFGFESSEEIFGTPAVNLYVHPSTRQRLMRRVAEEGVVRNFTALMKREGADPWHGEITCVALFGDKGEPAGIAGVCRDVTEQLQVLGNLHALREFNETVLNTIPSAILSIDCDGNITLANDAACRLSEAHREELVGKNAFKDAPAWVLDQKEGCQEVLRTSIFKVASGVAVHDRQRRVRFIDITILPLHHEGETTGAIIEASDVTDHVLLARRCNELAGDDT